MKMLIASGGSGGHIFPATALIDEMLKRIFSIEVIFIISGRPEEKKILNYIRKKISNIKVLTIPILPLRGKGFYNNFRFFFNFVRGAIYSFLLVLFLHPRIAVGFGGILSFPLLFSAFLLRIPTLIHEQNVYPGKANRWLSYLVNTITVSFEDSKSYFRVKDKIIFTGNPIRPDLVVMDKETAIRKLGLNPSFFTVLILGGSQGASVINNYFLNISERIIKEKIPLQIIHITGEKDVNRVAEKYSKLGIPAKVFSFYEDMGVLYSSADLVIGRAGASTLNEIAFFAKPAIVIPYPHAENHQLLNAFYYAQRNALFCIEEKDINSDETYFLICDIIKNKAKRDLLSESIKKLSNPSAAKLLTDAVEKLIELK